MKIYVASSWRNYLQAGVVAMLRSEGHEVYDFKHPKPGDDGFQWAEIDPAWQFWDAREFRDALTHPVADRGFGNDFDAMQWADAFVLVLPCGRSAHLEAGWAIGQGKPTCIFLDGENEPELMYKMAAFIALDANEMLDWAGRVEMDLIRTEVRP